MTTDKLAQYRTRDSILQLLSDDEVASVSTAETARGLVVGDEYVDLEQLVHGVQRAGGSRIPMGRLLPKKAVRAETWDKVLGQLRSQSS